MIYREVEWLGLEMDENNIFAGGNLVTRPATVIPVIGHQKIACEGYR